MYIRVHYVSNNSSVDVISQEGGFAANIMHDNNVSTFLSEQGNPLAEIRTSNDVTLIYDLLDARKGRFCKSEPNSNLVSSKVIVPQLKGTIAAKTSAKFACAVYAQPNSTSFNRDKFLAPISVPDEKELENLKSQAEIVKCNIPGKGDDIMMQQMSKMLKIFGDN
ncbi:unnamed protein product [Debaryomyces tyrocola]|nr:unnamed protein product [Debaryomyces tyrocola]